MKNLTYIFVATLFMVACNNEEISSLQDGKNLEVKFTSNLTGYDSQVVSRVNGTSFENGDDVAIWASSAGIAPFKGKQVLTAGADGKLSSTETFTYKDNNEVSFSALYPASLCDGTDQSDITLTTQTDDNGHQTLQDLLYATGKGSAGKPTVKLPFYHKGVKIDVAVKQGDGISLEGAEVFVKAKSGGVFSFANSSITPTGAEATDIKIPLAVVPDFTNNVNYGSTIVAPQTLEGECIGIKLQGEATTKYLTYSKIELKEGFRYCFHIDTRKNDVGETEISIASTVSEEPWISDVTVGEVEVGEVQILNKCLKLTGSGTNQTQAFYQISGTFPSGTYTFSCKVKSSTEITGGNLYFQTTNWEDGQDGEGNVFSSSTSWSIFRKELTIQEKNNDKFVRFFIQFNANPEDYILIDDMSLTRAGEEKNYIENSDFSDGTTKGWDSYGNNVSLGEY
ncbi:fimbrillin family protein [Bacteroides caecigallinarum]|uniref:fimbrillin family protein n=1 Tax=Bacteroides caecigallinarum TaxID=1411144 RepID=UPI001F1C6979|nr:fimbrillin family protein [Bacteroides caecigallinarum]MCF2592565.1 fimbrillin family protein [Bacteroides caecigallinarum]